MNINDIKAALAAKAAGMNIQPVSPTPAISPAPKEEKAAKPKTTRKTNTKATAKTEAPTPKVEVQPTPNQETPETKPATKKPRRTSKKSETPDTANIEAVIAANLKPGIDYNTIPGLGRKPALLKAGAEKLAAIFGFRSTSEIVHRIEDLKASFVLYEVETHILDQNGNIVAVGLGSCNSRERRYTRDFAGSLNTVLQMAKKRSYVDAILTACHASGVFTQDIEDIGRDLQLAEKDA